MKTRHWLALLACLLASFGWLAIGLQRGIKSAYYEWGVTCMIVAYAEEHAGEPPTSWDDLVGYEYHTKYLPQPRTIESAKQSVALDFEAVVAFANHDISELPETVVLPIRGIQQHWINPKATLENYFVDRQIPAGVLDKESAMQLRTATEGGQLTPRDW